MRGGARNLTFGVMAAPAKVSLLRPLGKPGPGQKETSTTDSFAAARHHEAGAVLAFRHTPEPVTASCASRDDRSARAAAPQVTIAKLRRKWIAPCVRLDLWRAGAAGLLLPDVVRMRINA